MSDAAARALGLDLDQVHSPEDAQRVLLDHMLAEADHRRDDADRKARADASQREMLRGGLDDVHHLQHAERTGVLASRAFVHWIATGAKSLDLGSEIGQKAAIVEDDVGRVLVPVDTTVAILREVALRSAFRELVTPRPTTRDRQVQGLLTAATAAWGKIELGNAPPDANTVPDTPPLEVEVHDATSLCKIGEDELADSPLAVEQSVVEAVADAIVVLEDTAFSVGTGTDEPRGLADSVNVARVAAGQKTSASASATPTIADLTTVVAKLPARYRARATWLFSEDAFAKVLALQWASGDSLMPRAGEGIGPFGWPYRVAPLPAMTPAGSTDASVWFTDLNAAFRIVDREGLRVRRLRQLFADDGQIGLLVTKRTGADMVRPEACSLYLL